MPDPIPTATPSYQVFLSYSRTDPQVKLAAEALRIALVQAGLSVFKDDHAIQPGNRWVSRLEEALSQCGAYVVLVGHQGIWRWVGAELQIALIRHLSPHDDAQRLPLFPILLGDTSPEVLPPFLALFQATRWSPDLPLPDDLITAIQTKSIRLDQTEPFVGCPFLGLNAFDRKDARLFFGRRKETLDALAKLGDQRETNPERLDVSGGAGFVRWLQIAGNSGAGKSSLVRAGMLPMIESGSLWARTGFDRWQVLEPMLPGKNPLATLAEVVERGLISDESKRDSLALEAKFKANAKSLARRVRDLRQDQTAYLLIIDQFEELFTFAEDEPRKHFDAVLAHALQDPQCPLFLISTVRLDFLDRFERLPKLLEVHNSDKGAQYILPTITERGLREVIEGPARLAGLDVSPVTAAILADARDEIGALPLVENALTTLWNDPKRPPDRLSGEKYAEAGGLAGMLASQADILLEQADRETPKGRHKALELLLRLIRVSDQGRHSRQRISLEEAIEVAGLGDAEQGHRLIRLLSGQRDAAAQAQGAHGGLRLITVSGEPAVNQPHGKGSANGQAANGKPAKAGANPAADRHVDLIHETLVRARSKDEKTGKRVGYWPTLYDYIEKNRDRDLHRQQLQIRAEQWQQSGPVGHWWYLAGWISLWAWKRLRASSASTEGRYLRWSRWVAWAQGSALAVVLGLFAHGVLWVRQYPELPFWYAIHEPLWLLGYQPLPETVEIPAGSFTMGCKPERDLLHKESKKEEQKSQRQPECDPSELPAHTVTIKAPFQMGKFEVTFLQYDYSIWDRKRKGGDPDDKLVYPKDENWGRWDRPVIYVSWDDARAYVDWLRNKTDNKSWRLPSEAQWEYASRAGNDTDAFWWGKSFDQALANCRGKKTAPVGQYPANKFGLHDTAGNVWEWVEDPYHETYEGAPADGMVWPSEAERSSRVLRGGSWYSTPRGCRAALRFNYDPDFRDDGFGFRVCRVAPIE